MNNYYKAIEGIMNKHPNEVLKNPHHTVWTNVMDFYWSKANDPRIRKKRYVRNWLANH